MIFQSILVNKMLMGAVTVAGFVGSSYFIGEKSGLFKSTSISMGVAQTSVSVEAGQDYSGFASKIPDIASAIKTILDADIITKDNVELLVDSMEHFPKLVEAYDKLGDKVKEENITQKMLKLFTNNGKILSLSTDELKAKIKKEQEFTDDEADKKITVTKLKQFQQKCRKQGVIEAIGFLDILSDEPSLKIYDFSTSCHIAIAFPNTRKSKFAKLDDSGKKKFTDKLKLRKKTQSTK